MVNGLLKKILFKNKDYEEICCLQNIKKYFWHINWLKTVWFNIKVLPLNKAIKLPFIISYNCKINNLGKIILKNKIYPGMISIGVVRIEALETNEQKTILTNHGKIIFSGRTKFHPGTKICVTENAILSLGERNSFGANTKIVSQCAIIIGNDFRISWNGQILDTDFHFLSKVSTGKIYLRKKPITFGDNVFIGNSSSIGKGTNITTGSVISCHSKVSGDFSSEGNYLLIVGNPAKVVAKGFTMISSGWFPKKELEYQRMLNEAEQIKLFHEKMNL